MKIISVLKYSAWSGNKVIVAFTLDKRFSSTWASLREAYARDPSRILTYNDPLAFKVDGRVFKPDPGLLNPSDPLQFPLISGWNLNGKELCIPNDISTPISFVSLSLRGGLAYSTSWTAPALHMFGQSESISIYSICLNEYGFLKYVRNQFARNIKRECDESMHDKTIVTFGNVNYIATELLLPSKYSGYIYLLDSKRRVRWRGCGMAEDSELERLLNITNELLTEEKLPQVVLESSGARV